VRIPCPSAPELSAVRELCVLDLNKPGSDVSRFVSLTYERRHSANLFVHGTCGVLDHRSLSYSVLGKSALPEGLEPRTSDILSASIQDVGVNHRRFNILLACNSVIEYKIHERLRNV